MENWNIRFDPTIQGSNRIMWQQSVEMTKKRLIKAIPQKQFTDNDLGLWLEWKAKTINLAELIMGSL